MEKERDQLRSLSDQVETLTQSGADWKKALDDAQEKNCCMTEQIDQLSTLVAQLQQETATIKLSLER